MAYTKRPAGGIIIEYSSVLTANWLGPWVEVEGVAGTITLPGGSPSKVDITTHRDIITYGGFKQNGAGLIDVTDLAFMILADPDSAGYQFVLADMAARNARDYRITYPGVTRKHGVRGQISVAPSGDPADYLRSQCTVLANAVNFNVV